MKNVLYIYTSLKMKQKFYLSYYGVKKCGSKLSKRLNIEVLNWESLTLALHL